MGDQTSQGEAPGGAPSPPPVVAALRRLRDRVEAFLARHLVGGDPVLAPDGRSSNDLAEDRTLLAVERTLMAADRSLMAWIRTALSMMSFGFTIYKLLQGFEAGGQLTVGLFLTSMGTFATVAGILEYWNAFKGLRRYRHIDVLRPSFVFAVAMAVAGLFLFFSIILKVF
jgi:putative membrane protein